MSPPRIAAVARVAILTLFSTAGPVSARVSDGAIRVEVDARRVGVEDTLTLQIVFEGSAVDVSPSQALPSLANLEIIGGPSSSMQMSFVNGTMSRTRTISYALRALREGNAEVGSLRVTGFEPTSPIRIDVVKGAIRPAAPAAQDPFDLFSRDPFEDFFSRSRRDATPVGKVLVTVQPSRTRLRVGESLRLSYFVLTQISIAGVEFADAPKYPGFWAEELKDPSANPGGDAVVHEGEEFRRVSVLERLLTPTRAGTLEIPAARIRLSPLARGLGVGKALERRTDALRIVVDPLPATAPLNGAVGSYAVTASLERDRIVAGEATTLRFAVEGRGNLKWIDAATEIRPEGAAVKVFPPRLSTDFRVTPRGIEGRKVWEYVVVPGGSGTTRFPALSFSYFDPDTQAARTVSTEALTLETLSSAPNSDARPLDPSPTGLALRSDLDEGTADVPPWGLAALLVISAVLRFGRPRVASPNRLTSVASATTIALARQRIAEVAATKGATKERVATTIEECLGDVFGPKDRWLDSDDDCGEALRALHDEIQFLRFAPQLGAYEEKIRDVADRALALVERASAR